MEVAATPANRALAAAVSGRMGADAMHMKARAAFWRALGLGACIGLAGIGIGAACIGYSYIVDATSSSQRIADAIVAGLQRTTIRTAGSVQLDSAGSTVKLDATHVSLDAEPLKLDPAATVRLDPAAEVRVVGPIGDMPTPTKDQLREGDKPAGPQAEAKVVTDFTVFKNVSVGTGRVVTGWTFASSDQKVPNDQYCYYTKDSRSSVSTNTYLAMNGVLLADVVPIDGVDIPAVSKRCLWFDGRPTRAP